MSAFMQIVLSAVTGETASSTSRHVGDQKVRQKPARSKPVVEARPDEAMESLVHGACTWALVRESGNPAGRKLAAEWDVSPRDPSELNGNGLAWLSQLSKSDRARLYGLPRRMSPFVLPYLAYRREFCQMVQGMRKGQRARDDLFIRAASGVVSHELQLRLIEADTFARCLRGQEKASGADALEAVRQELMALGSLEASRVHALAECAVGWLNGGNRGVDALIPHELLCERYANGGADGMPIAVKLLALLDDAQRRLLEEARDSQRSLRETNIQQRDAFRAAFEQMRSEPLPDLTDLFTLSKTYGVLEARLALVEAKIYMRFASLLKADQRIQMEKVLV